MRFRPEDQYCKPSIAKSNKTSNLLLKVKRRRIKTKLEDDNAGGGEGEGEGEGGGEKKREGDGEAMEVESGETTGIGKKMAKEGAESNGGQEEYKYSMELIGVINTTYQFSGI